jgi:hypothetical protein
MLTALPSPVDVRNNQGRFGSNPVRYSIVRDIRERRQMEHRLQEMARMESVDGWQEALRMTSTTF